MKTFITLFFLALSLFVCSSASAAITSGYYRIVSYNSKYMTENTKSQTVICSDKNDYNYAQVWYLTVSGTNVTLKNALTDRYVQKTSGNGWSEQYTTGSSSASFTLGERDGGYTFTDKWNGGPHCDAALNVVLWLTSEEKSLWTVEPVTIDQDALNEQQAALTEATNTQLLNVFTDLSCSALKPGYTNAQVRDLPSSTQSLVTKIKNNSWTTYRDWDKTERTFRVADYKAYSSYSRWTNILGLRYNLARTENPTGIYVEVGDYLQVYVGDVPTGQSVQLAVAGYGAGGYGGSGTVTYSLHSGMNALRMDSEGNCFVIYQVDNTTNGAAPYTALSNYADVTVHIEGGTVQGYFDLTKGDDNDDWTQLKNHLMSKNMFCMKTKTLVFNLQTDLVKTAVDGAGGSGSTGELTEMLEYWQGVQDMEDDLFNRASLGGANYEYCNNVHSVTTIGNSGDGLLYAYTNGIYFSPEQHNRLFNNQLIREGSDNLWASAHELGHHRQGQINMVGNTEISNNIYSNVAVYQQGRYTSRTASLQAVFSDYQNGISWPERVRLANSSGDYNQQLLHLNWSLYMFFHINGNKPTFYQDLYTAFRKDPMTNTAGTDKLTPANTDYLKYYVKCCQVSGYDLTDFFAAYGFFMLPPEQTTEITYNGVTTKRYQTIGDYGTYNLYVTQDMIDAAKKQVKAMSGLKQCNIVFIEDRVSAPLATYDGHAEGELKQPNDASSVTFGSVGETGQYTDFDAECSAYSYNVSKRGNVTMQGSGAVGFMVYDSNGNIIGYYNTNSFSLPEGVTGYTIKAAAGDGTTVASTRDASIEVQEFPKTGVWYTLSTPLRGIYYTTSNGAGEGVVGAATSTSEPTNAMQWQFVLREGEYETFDIVNRNDGSYLDPSATYNTQIETSTDQPDAGWKLQSAATAGLYIIVSGSAQLNQTNNGGTNGNMLYNWGSGSNTGDAGCQFAINEVNELSSTALEELEGLQISVSPAAADNLETGQWYVMFDRGANHGYLYENVSSHTLYNTNTAPLGTAVDNAKYLVRLEEAPGDGYYYLQDGFGNYFWDIQNSTAVATTGYAVSRIKVAKINSTDGHFYLQCANSNVVLDANDTYSGDATVVGYGTTATATGGNNDWAFYPVTLQRPVTLNVVGNKSYATFYYDTDVQTDGTTRAYYITTANNGFAQLIETPNEGTDIPAFTAVVLINDQAEAATPIVKTSGLTSVVSQDDNLLKGTLFAKTLDLSDASPYYTLGKQSDKVGFYKMDDASFTLSANKAYLEVVGGTGSKGFIFTFDDITGIQEFESPSVRKSETYYTIDGRKMKGQPTAPGIYVTGKGKKVIVR